MRRDSSGFPGKQAMLSPRYTTRWNELLVVKA
ncbi:DUF4113 domain-containing protein (plasmid) [Escherichia coli]|nr:DUF4113 domain-containing protein [Escherichia coli]UKO83370.1 DUF4113 domain-containing protein [Escherichia coli]